MNYRFNIVTFFITMVIKVAIFMAFDDGYTWIVFHNMHCKIVWFVKKSIIIYGFFVTESILETKNSFF